MGRIKIDQEKFDLVKALLKAGVRKNQVHAITGLSGCTIKNVEDAEDLEEYRRIVDEQFAKKKAYDKAKEHRELFKGLPLDTQSTYTYTYAPVETEQPKVQEGSKKPYTVTMVINVDEEHDKLVAPLTALINNMFDSDNVAVEVQQK